MNSLQILERRAVCHLPRLSAHSNRRSLSILHTPVPTFSQRQCVANRPRVGRLSFPAQRSSGRVGAKVRYSTSNSPDPTPHLGSPQAKPSLTLSQRLKSLSREYGWTAVGVYLALSALDFPFCFLAVRTLGTDRIAAWEHAVIEWGKSVLSVPLPNLVKDAGHGLDPSQELENASLREGSDLNDVELAEMSNSGSNASIWTQLALAYAIHKSFIFIRVPLTAALLPKIVKVLRGWGWNIGKKGVKAKLPQKAASP